MSFPIFERTDVVHIEKQRFTLVRKGNDVVSIEPPGRYGPLYQRQRYRDTTRRWREVTRFVSHENIDWRGRGRTRDGQGWALRNANGARFGYGEPGANESRWTHLNPASHGGTSAAPAGAGSRPPAHE